MSRRLEPLLLLTPGLAVLALAFFLPVAQVLVLSFDSAGAEGEVVFGFSQFVRFLGDSHYHGVALRTLRLGVIITAFTLVIGFPLAYVIARAGPRLRFWLIVLTILPLMTSVVIRTFGWLVILGNGGVLSWVLESLGLVDRPIALMHTEAGIVIAMVQVLLPFMTLTIAGVMGRIEPHLEEASRTMGAGFFATVRHVTIPLSLPGIVSGSLLVFALSISFFITPQLVGGVRLPVMATSIYQQVTSSLDWPFAAAQSMILLLAALAIVVPYALVLRGRRG